MSISYSLPLVVNSTIQSPTQWPGGTGVLVGVATSWASGVYTLNYLGPDGLTYISLAVTISANGVSSSFVLPLGLIKVVLSAGTPTVAYVNAAVIPSNLN